MLLVVLLLLLLVVVVVVLLLTTTMAFSSIVPCYSILDTTTPGLTEEDTAAGATPTSRLAGRG